MDPTDQIILAFYILNEVTPKGLYFPFSPPPPFYLTYIISFIPFSVLLPPSPLVPSAPPFTLPLPYPSPPFNPVFG